MDGTGGWRRAFFAIMRKTGDLSGQNNPVIGTAFARAMLFFWLLVHGKGAVRHQRHLCRCGNTGRRAQAGAKALMSRFRGSLD